MTDFSGWLGDVAAGAAKGAAMGSVVPGLGTGIGAAIGVATALVPDLATVVGIKPEVAAQVAGVVQEAAGEAGGLSDPEKLSDLRAKLAAIAAKEQAAADAAQVEKFKAAVADAASARAHDLQVRTIDNGRNTRADVMLAITVIGIVASLGVAIWGHLDGDNAAFGLIAGLVGVFSKCFSDAFAFEFGSSRGSKSKDATIAAMSSAADAASNG